MTNSTSREEIKQAFAYFSLNGEIMPIAKAIIPLSNIEYSYGFGVYETLRAAKGKILFPKEHAERLMESARIIGLEHSFTANSIQANIAELVKQNQAETCNLKVLLIGANDKESANLYILCLNPLFPDRKLYSAGAKCITQKYERIYPHAKTLNMLPSYLAYREAKKVGAYDALAVNQQGCITEGTRTNFFAIKDKQIISPPEKDILLGVTRDQVLKSAQQNDFEVIESDIPLSELQNYDGFFLTSTSSKIMPISSIDDKSYQIPASLRELMQAYDAYLKSI